MKHLSGLDSSFLHLESPEMPMHVGGLHILDLPPGYAGDFYEDLKRFVASRMHLAASFQRKLALMPFDLANPVWDDDEDVDLDYHVRHVMLPKPGTMKQLHQYVARLHSSLLDRSRPLWEFYLFEGLESGQVALYSKLHHAGMDGQAAQTVARAIFDLTPEPRKVKPPRVRHRRNHYQLGMAELASAALSNTGRQLAGLVRALPEAARSIAAMLPLKKGEDGKRHLKLPGNWTLSPRTQINVSITNQRAYAARSLPFAELKQMAAASGATINDLVLAIASGALRQYLKDYDGLPAKAMTAAVPVSLRESGDASMDNQVWMMQVGLATDLRDPLARLKAIHESANAAKESMGRFKGIAPTDFPSLGVPWIMSGLAAFYSRAKLADILPPIANVLISNVPGSPVPLYIAGAKVTTFYPVSIPAHGVALNITVQSYNGSLDWGLIACRRALPDVADLADYIVAEHAALRDAILAAPKAVPAAAPKLPAPKAAKPAPLGRTRKPRAEVIAIASRGKAKPARQRKAAATAKEASA